MKQIEEIKNGIAVKNGYPGWNTAYIEMDYNAHDSFINECMQEYAKQCCDEQKIQCAENAKVIVGNLLERTPRNKHFWNMNCNFFVEADQDSILNTPNVVTK